MSRDSSVDVPQLILFWALQRQPNVWMAALGKPDIKPLSTPCMVRRRTAWRLAHVPTIWKLIFNESRWTPKKMSNPKKRSCKAELLGCVCQIQESSKQDAALFDMLRVGTRRSSTSTARSWKCASRRRAGRLKYWAKFVQTNRLGLSLKGSQGLLKKF